MARPHPRWHLARTSLPLHLPKDTKPLWKLPLGGGYGGIAVANDKLFVMDRIKENEVEELERIHCLEPLTGKQLWLHSYKAAYKNSIMGTAPVPRPPFIKARCTPSDLLETSTALI